MKAAFCTNSAKIVVEALVGEAYQLWVSLRHSETDALFFIKLYALTSVNVGDDAEYEPFRVTLFDEKMTPLNHWEVPKFDTPPWSQARWGEFCTAGIPPEYDFKSVKISSITPDR